MRQPTIRDARVLAIASTLLLVLPALPAPAARAARVAAGDLPKEIRHLCIAREGGLARYVTNRSDCRSTERAHSFPIDGELDLCGRVGGLVRRAGSGSCGSAPVFELPGPVPRYFCSTKGGASLRRVDAGDDCPSGETPVVLSVPVARDDAYTTNEDRTLKVAAPGVLANDADLRGRAMTAVLVSGPDQEAAFQLKGDGSFTYTPRADFRGADQFTYRTYAGSYKSQVRTVSIAVRSVNDAPTFTKGPDQSVDQDSPAQTVAKWATAIKPGPANESTQDVHFAVTVTANPALFSVAPAVAPNGTLTYTPAAKKSGVATVSVTAVDDGGTANGGDDTSSVQTFKITVNSKNASPAAVADSYTALEDGTLTVAAPGVLTNDTDGDGDPLTAAVAGAPAHASAFALTADGAFSYTPDANFCGSDSFTYTVSDGTATSTAQTVTITVTCVNDEPSFTKGADQTVNQDSGAQTVPTWATAIKAGPANEAGQTLTFEVTGNTNPGLFSAGPAVSEGGTLTYTPKAGASGSAEITVRLADSGGTANGGDDTSGTQKFTITVNHVNATPAAGTDSYNVLEDGTLTQAAPGVLGNDTDADGESLTATPVTGPAHGSLTLNADGSFVYTPAANFCGADSFTYQASDGTAHSSATTAGLAVTCVNDEPSYTKGAGVTVDQDSGPQSVEGWATQIKAGPSNESGQTLTFEVTGNSNPGLFAAGPAVAANGTLTFTPKAGASGDATVTLALKDDGGTANGGDDTSPGQTFAISVSHVNAAPVAAADDYTVGEDSGTTSIVAPGVLTNDTDADADALTAVLVTGPGHGTLTLNADGSFSYTPTANWCGDDSFTYKASDGAALSAAASVKLRVTCADDAPVPTTSSGNASYTENADPTTVDSGITLTEPDGDAVTGATVAITSPATGDVLAFTPSGGITGSYAAGTLTLSGTASAAAYQAALRTVTYANTTEGPAAGTRTVTFTVTAGTQSATATRGVAVTAVNDLPTAVDDTGTTDEDTTLNVAAPGVLGNDGDADPGDSRSVTKLNGSAVLSGASAKGGTVTILADGSYSYVPPAAFQSLSTGQHETDTFAYTMADGAGATSTATVTITVNGVSDAPTAAADSFDVIGNTGLFVGTERPDGDAGKQVTGSLLANDTDPDTSAANLVVEPVTGAATTLGGTITIHADGTFTYQPDDGDTGVTDTFTYRVCDATPCTSSTVANSTGTLSLPIAGQVWYVRNDQPAGGDGTSDTPFDTLTEAETASGAADTVYVFDGDNTSAGLGGGYSMNAGERLIGESRPLSVDPDSGGPLPTSALFPGTAGAQPTLTASDEDVVTLATSAVLDGFDLDPSGAGGGIFGGSGVSGPTIAHVNVADTGTAGSQPGLELVGTTGTTDVSNFTVTNGGSAGAVGVRLSNAGTVLFAPTGTVTVSTNLAKALDASGTNLSTSQFDDLVVTGSQTGGVSLSNVTGNPVLGDGNGTDLSLVTAGGTTPAFSIQNSNNVTVNGGGTDTVSATGGPAVDIVNSTGSSFDFDSVSSANSATTGGASGDGINIDSIGGSPFAAAAGTVGGAAGKAVDINGGSGAITYGGAITDGPGAQAVEITGRAGDVTLSGTIADGNDAGGGIVVSGGTAGTITFSGTSKVVNTGASDAVLVTGNTVGGAVRFLNGGLDIDATSGRGLDASSNAASIEVGGTGNSITTTTGRALNVANTPIAAGGVTLQSVSANGAANGILLNNTGTAGGLTVTGNGGNCAAPNDACTGGTIQATSGDAVSLTSTKGVSLTRVKIRDNLGNGIRGAGVTNLSLRDSVVDNNGNDAATDEAGVHLTNLAGTADITRTVVSNSPEDNARIVNASGTLDQLTVADSVFRDTDTADPGNNGLLIEADGGSITADVTGSSFLRNRANGLQVVTNGTGSMDVGVAGSTFDDNYIGLNLAHNSAGVDGFVFDARNLTVDGVTAATSASPVNVNLGSLATTTMQGTVADSIITNHNSSTGPGIRVLGNGTATMTVALTGNTISQVANRGIDVAARDGSNTVNATIRDNTVTLTEPTLSLDAIRVDSGATATDTTKVCADIANNSATTIAGLNGIRVRQRFAGTTFRLEGYGGSGTDNAAVVTYLKGRNASTPVVAADQVSGFGTVANCPEPS